MTQINSTGCINTSNLIQSNSGQLRTIDGCSEHSLMGRGRRRRGRKQFFIVVLFPEVTYIFKLEMEVLCLDRRHLSPGVRENYLGFCGNGN